MIMFMLAFFSIPDNIFRAYEIMGHYGTPNQIQRAATVIAFIHVRATASGDLEGLEDTINATLRRGFPDEQTRLETS